MFSTYITIAQAIKDKVKQIRWFDLDKGQLEQPEMFHSIITPGVLVGQQDITWRNTGSTNRIGDGEITVKLVLTLPSNTYLLDPLVLDHLKELALAEDISLAVLAVPGVSQLINTRDYPQPPFYVVEQTYSSLFKAGPTYQSVPVQVKINPFLTKPTANA